MTSKASRAANFSEQENLLLTELGRDFPEVESKGYDGKTVRVAKNAKAWVGILTKFNSQNPNGIRRDVSQLQGCWKRLKLQSKKEHDLHRREARKTGGGVADVIPGSVNPVEQEFDDDAGEELDLRRDKDER